MEKRDEAENVEQTESPVVPVKDRRKKSLDILESVSITRSSRKTLAEEKNWIGGVVKNVHLSASEKKDNGDELITEKSAGEDQR